MLFPYGAKSMPSLEQDLPEHAAKIREALSENSALKEAFADYQTACRKEEAFQGSQIERAEWARIRQELLEELMRLSGCSTRS